MGARGIGFGVLSCCLQRRSASSSVVSGSASQLGPRALAQALANQHARPESRLSVPSAAGPVVPMEPGSPLTLRTTTTDVSSVISGPASSYRPRRPQTADRRSDAGSVMSQSTLQLLAPSARVMSVAGEEKDVTDIDPPVHPRRPPRQPRHPHQRPRIPSGDSFTSSPAPPPRSESPTWSPPHRAARMRRLRKREDSFMSVDEPVRTLYTAPSLLRQEAMVTKLAKPRIRSPRTSNSSSVVFD